MLAFTHLGNEGLLLIQSLTPTTFEAFKAYVLYHESVLALPGLADMGLATGTSHRAERRVSYSIVRHEKEQFMAGLILHARTTKSASISASRAKHDPRLLHHDVILIGGRKVVALPGAVAPLSPDRQFWRHGKLSPGLIKHIQLSPDPCSNVYIQREPNCPQESSTMGPLSIG